MERKQVSFDMGVYSIDPEAPHIELGRMKQEIKLVQKNGWEVREFIYAGNRLDGATNRHLDVIYVPMVKYEEVNVKVVVDLEDVTKDVLENLTKQEEKDSKDK